MSDEDLAVKLTRLRREEKLLVAQLNATRTEIDDIERFAATLAKHNLKAVPKPWPSAE